MAIHALVKFDPPIREGRRIALTELALEENGEQVMVKTPGGFHYTIQREKGFFRVEIPALKRTFFLDNHGKIFRALGGPIPELEWKNGEGGESFYPIDVLLDGLRNGDATAIDRYYGSVSIAETTETVHRNIKALTGSEA